MSRKVLVFLVLAGCAVGLPVQALAQTQQPPADYWFGPGFMWGGGWSSFWWICPLMMIAMMAVMMFVCRSMCLWHRD